jgi:hypothetical protein
MIKNNRIKYIQFEFGGTNIDSKIYFRDFYYMLNNDYKIYRILRNGLRYINRYEEKLEIFSYSNFLVESRN